MNRVKRSFKRFWYWLINKIRRKRVFIEFVNEYTLFDVNHSYAPYVKKICDEVRKNEQVEHNVSR